MDQVNTEKNLPLNLLGAKEEGVEEDGEEAWKLFGQCLTFTSRQRLHLIQPRTSTEFLTAIQNMPEWLRDVAVIRPTVQTMLNAKISLRFPTMILMLDFYFLLGAIGGCSITADESLSRRFNPLNTTNASRSVSGALLSLLYIRVLYFFVWEVRQMILVRSQTTFFAYLSDPENMVNLAFIFMTMSYTIIMQTGTGNDD
ncbi:hypothetical protein ACHAWF_014305 [Thalassiosira exigua]